MLYTLPIECVKPLLPQHPNCIMVGRETHRSFWEMILESSARPVQPTKLHLLATTGTRTITYSAKPTPLTMLTYSCTLIANQTLNSTCILCNLGGISQVHILRFNHDRAPEQPLNFFPPYVSFHPDSNLIKVVLLDFEDINK